MTVPLHNLTDTWNDGGTTFNAIKMNVTNTASASASLLMDLQVGSTSRFKIDRNGAFTATLPVGFGQTTTITSADTANTALHLINTDTGGHNYGFFSTGSSVISGAFGIFDFTADRGLAFNGATGSFCLPVDGSFCWSSTVYPHVNSPDTFLYRDGAANIIAQRNSTSAQIFRLYNTYTDASNYERFNIEWSSGYLNLRTEKAGTGSNRDLRLHATSGIIVFVGLGSSITPEFNGDLVMQATSNTSLTFKYKGSDGTVRSGSVTLA
jgi:hypothetical protein